MAARRYVGAMAEILTILDGREQLVKRGGRVSVSEVTAKKLDTDPANWATVAPPKPEATNPNEQSYDFKEGDR